MLLVCDVRDPWFLVLSTGYASLISLISLIFAQRSSGGPIPGNIQDQVGQGSGQPGLVEDVPAHCRGLGLDDL